MLYSTYECLVGYSNYVWLHSGCLDEDAIDHLRLHLSSQKWRIDWIDHTTVSSTSTSTTTRTRSCSSSASMAKNSVASGAFTSGAFTAALDFLRWQEVQPQPLPSWKLCLNRERPEFCGQRATRPPKPGLMLAKALLSFSWQMRILKKKSTVRWRKVTRKVIDRENPLAISDKSVA